MEKEKNKDSNEVSKKSLLLMILLIFILVVLVIGVSYQVYLYTESGTSVINKIFGGEADVFKNGAVTLVYTEGEKSIRIENAVPMTDEEGMRLSKTEQLMDFTVSIDITKSSTVSYEVVAEKDPTSTIEDKYIKIYLQRSMTAPTYEEEIMMPTLYKGLEEQDEYGAPSGCMVLDQSTTSESIIYYYRLRMWLDSSYVLDNTYRYFTIKINVYAKGDKIPNNSTENTDKTDNVSLNNKQ